MISEELVIDDAPGRPVPKGRDGDLAGVIWIARDVGFVEILEAVHFIGNAIRIARIAREGPSLLLEPRHRVGHRDDVFELLERAIDQRPVRPGAAVRYIEMVAAGLGFEARRTVGADAVAKNAVGPLELSAFPGLLRQLAVGPLALDYNAHCVTPGDTVELDFVSVAI